MWFSILKNKLLTKPKTQLRIKDVKDIEDDEPCKKKLEEYYNHFKTQKDNYNIHNDTEITNIYNKHGLTTVEEDYYNDKAVISKHNNRFKGATLFGYYTVHLEKDAFSELPEKVACRFLDLIDNIYAGGDIGFGSIHNEEMDGYEMYVKFDDQSINPPNEDDWLEVRRGIFAYIKKAGSNQRRFYILSSSGTIFITQRYSYENDTLEMSNFYSDIIEIILDKLDPKNWK